MVLGGTVNTLHCDEDLDIFDGVAKFTGSVLPELRSPSRWIE
jgi:hypothetical protein